MNREKQEHNKQDSFPDPDIGLTDEEREKLVTLCSYAN